MFLRNYDNLFSCVYGQFPQNAITTSEPNHEKVYVRTTSGEYKQPSIYSLQNIGINATSLSIPKVISLNSVKGYANEESYSNIQSVFTYIGSMIKIGGGDTEPSYDDYDLLIPFVSNLALGNVTTSWEYNDTEHSYMKKMVIPIAYSGDTPITVNEWGLYVPVASNSGSKNDSTFATMIYKEKLATGITLQKNDTIEITFNQKVFQPNYTPYPSV